MKRGDTVHDSIGSDFHRVVHEYRHARFHTRFDEKCLLSEIDARHFSERPVHRRHDGTDDDAAN